MFRQKTSNMFHTMLDTMEIPMVARANASAHTQRSACRRVVQGELGLPPNIEQLQHLQLSQNRRSQHTELLATAELLPAHNLSDTVESSAPAIHR